MKIAVCVDLDLLSPGGVETHIRNLSSHLRPLLEERADTAGRDRSAPDGDHPAAPQVERQREAHERPSPGAGASAIAAARVYPSSGSTRRKAPPRRLRV